jgi:hypothetical protein
MKTGHRLWHRQLTPEDAYIVGCTGGRALNCPDDHGPDHDFGQSPILTSLPDGRRMLVIAQKSGVVHALDPDREGQILWQVRVGKGGTLGGSSADARAPVATAGAGAPCRLPISSKVRPLGSNPNVQKPITPSIYHAAK